MKKLILTFVFGFCLLSLKSAHIVGGEIEFIYVNDGTYRINLIQYFDEVQTTNPGPEATITVYIFRNADNALISTHNLFFLSQEEVAYTNIECAIDELQTSRVVWSNEVDLDPATYDDPAGYYIVWERCCRNDNVRNLENPNGTGMKYVLEIPPLMINGRIFINSSPVLFPPLSDYACVNQLYYVDFSGTDPDGDSLVYSLITPLNSSSAVALPTPAPKPHFDILYAPGFSASNIIPGNPSLRISREGLLTVTPSEVGLYVFSVRVEEYRNQVKIGETRRDFQMLVIDDCEPPDPPMVDVDIPGNPSFNPNMDTLTYTVGEAKCFDFVVSNVTPGDSITLRAEGVNFDDDFDEIFALTQAFIGVGQSELRVEVCIPDCPPLREEPFVVDLIAGDDACPLPQLDTLRLTIEVAPPPNDFPSTLSVNQIITLNEDSGIYSETISATDSDGDSLIMALYIEGISDPSVHGFELDITNSVAGSIQADFTWNTDCLVADFSEFQQFMVGILIEDLDTCMVPNPDTLYFDSRISLPANSDPQVNTSIPIPTQIDLGSTLAFDVNVFDSDNDEVSLTLVGSDFEPDAFDMQFDAVNGRSSATSDFSWSLTCDAELYEDGQVFELFFIGDDADRCKVKNLDTLKATIQANYPPNLQPEFDAISQIQTLRVNEMARIEITAFDEDQDQITLSFADGFRQPASESLSFETASGTGRVRSFLEWQPECSLFRFGEDRTLQDVVFQVVDDACPISSVDTLRVTFEIVNDQNGGFTFLPPNVFTPNGDGVNDTFTLSGNFDPSQNLPTDNCDNVFQSIVINNRVGSTVFESSNRDFIWTGGQFPAGVYYYLIKYSNSEFKGYIHLLR